jgi:hypothetical protein
MVVGVFKIGLQQVMIDILGGEFGAYARDVHGLELQHHQGAGGILGEGRIDGEAGACGVYAPALAPRLAPPQPAPGLAKHARVDD